MKTNPGFYHQAVLLHESIEQLNIRPDGVYLDATYGGGGHSRLILEKLGPQGRLIAFDQDADAKANLVDDSRLHFIPENFRYASRFLRLYGYTRLDGVLADLGVSSWQFDTADRGFSTRFEAELDMRMDRRMSTTAATVLNTYSEKQLQQVFEFYGEVTNARWLAKQIVQQRKVHAFHTANEFKQCIASGVYGNPNKFLAQVFQALRIEVNQELEVLKDFLRTITPVLSSRARLCVITFHSLEDRLVKQWMRSEAFEETSEWTWVQKKPSLQVIQKKPLLASDEEVRKNPRARSAKLRVAEKR
ncbi:MAG: 16S rRNA (cytosine(1402)-N(4))-methyltransferase RsmH [Chitinophagaceae bacterium]|nr:16S rRNA (cytosine(1402)-N(4))-methyltransferase RsmH [Chitinophagaceae bacterium]